MSDKGIEIICGTLVSVVLILAFFTNFFDNVFRRKE